MLSSWIKFKKVLLLRCEARLVVPIIYVGSYVNGRPRKLSGGTEVLICSKVPSANIAAGLRNITIPFGNAFRMM
jgi:hypothetical protein